MKTIEQKAKKVPAIRFAGFDDEWVEKKIFDVAEIVGGGTPSTANPQFWDGNIDWYAPAEINDQVFVNGSERKITKLGLENSSAKVLPANRTVLFTSRAGIGKTAILQSPAATNQGFQSLVLNDDTDTYFVYSMTDKIKAKAERIASGSTFAEISGKMLGNLELVFPSKKEQSKIGSFFSNIDFLILLEQKKYDKLTQVKKSMLEKMFPKEGATVPEIRFANFTGEWEKKKLGDMGTTYTGLSGKTKSDFGHGMGRFVTYMNVFLNPVSDPNRTEAVEIDNTQNTVQHGDVFFTTSSETPEEVGMSSVWLDKTENIYLNSFCFGYRPTENIDPFYLAYMLRSNVIRKKITYLAQGISRYNISKNGVMEIEVPLPKFKEQQKIGSYFSHLDSLISLQQRKLEKLKNIKKSLLEKMFV